MPPAKIHRLPGAHSSLVYKLFWNDGQTAILKTSQHYDVSLEAKMLCFLRGKADIPVPEVLFEGEECLILEELKGAAGINEAAQRHAADLLAVMHDISNESYGFSWETQFGLFPLTNIQTKNWIEFFREQRLKPALKWAQAVCSIPDTIARNVVQVIDRLEDLLPEPQAPSLIHGDLWKGNVLSDGDRITGIIDPALSYGNRESELAHGMLYDAVFRKPFFDRYREHYPLDREFFTTRCHLLNLFPLIVYTRVFKGGASLRRVDEITRYFAGTGRA